jgi:hypothetical protein
MLAWDRWYLRFLRSDLIQIMFRNSVSTLQKPQCIDPMKPSKLMAVK